MNTARVSRVSLAMPEQSYNACIAEASRADGVGTCPRCGITSIRTAVAGELRVLDGRVLRDSPPCRWGEPCLTMLAQCKRCDAETPNVQRAGAPWACDECGAVRHTLPSTARPVASESHTFEATTGGTCARCGQSQLDCRGWAVTP